MALQAPLRLVQAAVYLSQDTFAAVLADDNICGFFAGGRTGYLLD